MSARAPQATPLDVFGAALTDVGLIEASAGTGKTYTVSGLYLRLVLEAWLPVERILVVTYTKAATAELRERIRGRLGQARQVFLAGATEDPFHRELLARVADREEAVRRLTAAIHGFDEAAVFTIHGFCQRVLSDNAFESAMPFETEVLADEADVLREVVEDFWRRELYPASPLLVRYVLAKGLDTAKLLQAIRPHVGKPYLEIRGAATNPDPGTLEQAFTRSYAAARSQWQACRPEVEQLLLQTKGLNGNRYRPKSISVWAEGLSAYFQPEQPMLGSFDKLEKFTASYLQGSMNKGHAAPEHSFFDTCQKFRESLEALEAGYAAHLQSLERRLLEYADEQMESRKRRRRVLSYDDLLNNLHAALEGPGGEALAEAVRHQYAAALIDEFQDTDPVQYAIFRRLYRSTGLPVFLVGDPKQAIYSFRGADIYAYLAGREDAARAYTLETNWRSVPALVRALNTVFANPPQPFLFPEIPFRAARAASREPEFLAEAGAAPAVLRLWWLAGEDESKALGKTEAAALAAEATAVEIARLLNLGASGQARIGDRPLGGGDVAVLVRSHRQGSQVHAALLALGVPSVRHAQDSVFHSPEALDLERLLLALASPEREPLVRAALATGVLGVGGTDLYRMAADEQAWDAIVETFHAWHTLWHEHGFMPMFRDLLQVRGVAGRLLALPDGERRLTNLLHLAEMLQATADREHLGMEALVKWLGERRQAEGSDSDEAMLRLESDEHLVRIVTVHKSKGLQYPVVFCPFLWDGRLGADKDGPLSFHDPASGHAPVLAFGEAATGAAREQARREEMAESLRLLYVALTRAQQRCYVVWGAIKDAGTSPLAWVLHPPPDTAPGPAEADKHFRSLNPGALHTDLDRLVEAAGGSLSVEPAPTGPGEPFRPAAGTGPELRSRRFGGRIREPWRITSFSALATGHGVELPDYDAGWSGEAGQEPLAGAADIHAFPRGARPGECLHAIFERTDFAAANPEALDGLVGRTLAEYGFGSQWREVIARMVCRVLDTALDATGDLRLAGLPGSRRLNELEFYYSVTRIEPAGLRRLLAAHGLSAPGPLREFVETLTFAPARGYMKGFMDLVFEHGGRFHLVDYKSNWLGAEPSAYAQEHLPAVMARESYYLQYLIYTVALHRYLGRRLPDYDYERHFGGVYYLFLRGMDPEAGSARGVFHDRPAWRLVQALDAYLRGEGA